jgi:cystathionine gamma-lyase
LGIPFGGVVSFEIKGASEEETEKFLVKLRLISLAESLGGVESLIEAPYGMTHQVSILSAGISIVSIKLTCV